MKFSLLERENDENFSFRTLKGAFTAGVVSNLKTMCYNARKLKCSSFSRSKSKNFMAKKRETR